MKDTFLSSVCRLYELSVLASCVPEMQDTYMKELDYFLGHPVWRELWVSQIPDPRQRWMNLDIREPEVFKALVELVKNLANVEAEKCGGMGTLPLWASEPPIRETATDNIHEELE
jgi:hypothetical protein